MEKIETAQDVKIKSATHVDPKEVDTVHNDEAMKVLATYTGDENWVAEEEKKLVRKIDMKLLPILCTTYLLQYYDKAMLSQAVSNHIPDGFLFFTSRRFYNL